MVDDSIDLLQVTVELDGANMCYIEKERFVESADKVA